jgi:hypothetical protein
MTADLAQQNFCLIALMYSIQHAPQLSKTCLGEHAWVNMLHNRPKHAWVNMLGGYGVVLRRCGGKEGGGCLMSQNWVVL